MAEYLEDPRTCPHKRRKVVTGAKWDARCLDCGSVRTCHT